MAKNKDPFNNQTRMKILEVISERPFSHVTRIRNVVESKSGKTVSENSLRSSLKILVGKDLVTAPGFGRARSYAFKLDAATLKNYEMYHAINSFTGERKLLLKFLSKIMKEPIIQSDIRESLRMSWHQIETIKERFDNVNLIECEKIGKRRYYSFKDPSIFEPIKNLHEEGREKVENAVIAMINGLEKGKCYSIGRKSLIFEQNFTTFPTYYGNVKLCMNPMAEIISEMNSLNSLS